MNKSVAGYLFIPSFVHLSTSFARPLLLSRVWQAFKGAVSYDFSSYSWPDRLKGMNQGKNLGNGNLSVQLGNDMDLLAEVSVDEVRYFRLSLPFKPLS